MEQDDESAGHLGGYLQTQSMPRPKFSRKESLYSIKGTCITRCVDSNNRYYAVDQERFTRKAIVTYELPGARIPCNRH